MIPPGYYTIAEIIVIVKIDSHTSLHIHLGHELLLYLDPFPSHYRFTNVQEERETFGLESHIIVLPASFYGSNVIDITRNRQVIQVYSSLVRSSNLKIANQNNNLLTTIIIDDTTTTYYRSVEDICIPTINRFDRLIFAFMDLGGNIMRLNDEFELQLTIEDRVEGEGKESPLLFMLASQLSMIEVFGNNTKKEVKLDNPFSFDLCSISSVSLYTDFVVRSVPSDQGVVIEEGTKQHEVLIHPGVYDIETIIAMLKASDA